MYFKPADAAESPSAGNICRMNREFYGAGFAGFTGKFHQPGKEGKRGAGAGTPGRGAGTSGRGCQRWTAPSAIYGSGASPGKSHRWIPPGNPRRGQRLSQSLEGAQGCLAPRAPRWAQGSPAPGRGARAPGAMNKTAPLGRNGRPLPHPPLTLWGSAVPPLQTAHLPPVWGVLGRIWEMGHGEAG